MSLRHIFPLKRARKKRAMKLLAMSLLARAQSDTSRLQTDGIDVWGGSHLYEIRLGPSYKPHAPWLPALMASAALEQEINDFKNPLPKTEPPMKTADTRIEMLQAFIENCESLIDKDTQKIELAKSSLSEYKKELENLQQPKDGRWIPAPGDTYWYVDDRGDIEHKVAATGGYYTNRVQQSNVYKSKEEAETVGREDRRREAAFTAMAQLARRLNGDWKPNFKAGEFGVTYTFIAHGVDKKRRIILELPFYFKDSKTHWAAVQEYNTYQFEDGTYYMSVLVGAAI